MKFKKNNCKNIIFSNKLIFFFTTLIIAVVISPEIVVTKQMYFNSVNTKYFQENYININYIYLETCIKYIYTF